MESRKAICDYKYGENIDSSSDSPTKQLRRLPTEGLGLWISEQVLII